MILEKRYYFTSHWPFGYTIYFEDTTLLWVFHKDIAERFTGMLNGAFDLGKQTQQIENELEVSK